MSERRPCPHAEEAVGWAMQALEPEVESILAKHLPYCHVCRQVVSQTEEVMGTLVATAPQLEPRPEVRKRLMASVAATQQTPRDERERSWPAIGPAEVAAAAPHTPPGWRPWGPASRSRDPGPSRDRSPKGGPKYWRRVAVLAATALIALVGFGGLVVHILNSSPAQAQAQARTEQLQKVLAQADRPGSRRAVLRMRGGTPVAAVILTDGQRRVVTAGLPPNQPGDSIYVLWGLTGGAGKPASLGTFKVTESTDGKVTVGSGNQNEPFTGYAISLEKGTTAPNLPTVIVASGAVES